MEMFRGRAGTLPTCGGGPLLRPRPPGALDGSGGHTLAERRNLAFRDPLDGGERRRRGGGARGAPGIFVRSGRHDQAQWGLNSRGVWSSHLLDVRQDPLLVEERLLGTVETE